MAEIHQNVDEFISNFVDAGCTVKFLLNDYSFQAYRNVDDSYYLVDKHERMAGFQYDTVIERH